MAILRDLARGTPLPDSIGATPSIAATCFTRRYSSSFVFIKWLPKKARTSRPVPCPQPYQYLHPPASAPVVPIKFASTSGRTAGHRLRSLRQTHGGLLSKAPSSAVRRSVAIGYSGIRGLCRLQELRRLPPGRLQVGWEDCREESASVCKPGGGDPGGKEAVCGVPTVCTIKGHNRLPAP